MTRGEAARLARVELDKHGLTSWHVRINASLTSMGFLALCSYRDKCIILNAHHIDMNPDDAIKNSILHEIAHALVGEGHAHNEVWRAKAIEIGCDGIPCSHLSLNSEVIDAIRSGADIKVEMEKEVIPEQTIIRPKFTVTRLQDRCYVCNKVAVVEKESEVETKGLREPNLRFITYKCGHLVIKKIPKGTPFASLVSYANRSDVKSCQHEFDKNKCSKCGEYTPFKFQLEGMRFIEVGLTTNKGALVADEQGLGKTVQALGYLKFHPEMFPVLFVAKSGIKLQLMKEILRWLGDEYCPQVVEGSNAWLIPGLKTYIVSYDIMTPKTRTSKSGKTINQGFDIEQFNRIGIKTVVMDECQQIKNPDATRTQQVRRVVKDRAVIALSGTPWKNRGSELYTVLNMMAPTKFPSYEGFTRQWVDYYSHGNRVKEGGIRNVARFRDYTKDIIIRRERKEVMSELPLITRNLQHVELESFDQNTYDDEASEFVKWYNETITDENENSFANTTNILAKLARMRHIVALAKIPATMEFVDEFVEETERKLCIFVHHQDVGRILVDQCEKKYGAMMPILKITGDMNGVDRFNAQEMFNNNPRAIMIASTLAAAEGLNLQTGSDCIVHERQWNPANEEQAEGRFIRIGQTAQVVTATYMVAADTVDAILSEIVERKRVAFHAAMNRGEMPTWNKYEPDIAKELAEGIVRQVNSRGSRIKKMAKM